MTDPFQYLFSLELFGIKFGLDNIRAIVAAMDHPERAFRAVHVAGTNGKGSVAAMVESALREAGHRTGRYTSPHLIRLNERFAIDGAPIDDAALASAIERVRTAVDDLHSRGALDVQPTFFEVTTATAFELFRRQSVDVAVVETGLGGRLDATNVLTPMASAITSIAADHQQYLGETLSEIAAEKAGIIKPGIPVIVGEVDRDAFDVISRIAAERSAPLVRAAAGTEIAPAPRDEHGAQRIHLRTSAHDYGVTAIGLDGAHQVANAVVAVRLLESLDARGMAVPPDAIARGLARVRWPGRLERMALGDGRTAILDAAHNPAGAATLAAYLQTHAIRVPLVFAVMRDKDAARILEALTPHASAIVLTRASHPRSADPESLARIVRRLSPELPCLVEPSPAEAVAAAWRTASTILVAGSIFLLGDVMKVLGRS